MKEMISNKKKSEILAEQISTLHYGDMILHQQIAILIKEAYPTNKYRTIVSKAKKDLQKKGIFLESISGDGYRIVDPDMVVQQAMQQYKRGFKAMQKGYDVLNYAPTKDMTQEGLNTYRRIHDRAVTLTAAMKGVSVELKTLTESKQHPFAVENINR